jgi:hypothetical protein
MPKKHSIYIGHIHLHILCQLEELYLCIYSGKKFLVSYCPIAFSPSYPLPRQFLTTHPCRLTYLSISSSKDELMQCSKFCLQESSPFPFVPDKHPRGLREEGWCCSLALHLMPVYLQRQR